MMTLIYVLHFMVCFVLIAVVLLQRGKGSDIGAALGGGGANTVFGSRGAGNFLTRMTTGSAIIFMFTSLSLAYVGNRSSDENLFDAGEIESTAPATPSSPLQVPTTGSDQDDTGGLEEIPVDDLNALEEIPSPQTSSSGKE